jgi:hypothetical protein
MRKHERHGHEKSPFGLMIKGAFIMRLSGK